MRKIFLIILLFIAALVLCGGIIYYYFPSLCCSCPPCECPNIGSSPQAQDVDQSQQNESITGKLEQTPDSILDGVIQRIEGNMIYVETKDEPTKVETVEIDTATIFTEMTFTQESADAIQFKEEKYMDKEALKQGDEVSIILAAESVQTSGKKASAIRKVIVEGT